MKRVPVIVRIEWIGGLWRDTRGVSAMEFAFILPILLTLVFATAEFGRLIMLSQKLQNGTFIVADLTARDETPTQSRIDDTFLAFNNLIRPFDFSGSGTAIVSCLTADGDGDPMINWQHSGAGTLEHASDLGLTGEEAVLPEVLNLAPGETVIVAEIHYQYTPIFSISGDGHLISKYAYVRPRLGTLETLAP